MIEIAYEAILNTEEKLLTNNQYKFTYLQILNI